jgi:RimJ/RimL family protein N-acetyltransferase
MLEGILVDLVVQDKTYFELQHKWRNNESQFWGSGGDREPVTHAELERRRQWWLEHGGENNPHRGAYFGVQTKPDAPEPSKPIGFMSINWMNPTHRWGVLGAVIGEPEYWGGGYGTDGVLLLVDYAFDWFDFHRVWLMTTSVNKRVFRQMEKLGFTLEARRRNAALLDGEWHDWVYFGMLRTEWPGREALVERLGIAAK